MKSWKEFLPGFEIRLWNEDNFNVNAVPYTAEAYKAGKYAFVSDYARFAILYEHGGVYLDTDVQLIRPWEKLLTYAPFVGLEETGLINPGLGLAFNPGNDFCRSMLDTYSRQHFINTDGTYNLSTVCDYATDYFLDKGFSAQAMPETIDGINILPPQVLSPKSQITGKINITKETYAIHHYAGSWLTPFERFKLRVKDFTGPSFAKFYINIKHKLTGA